MAYVGTEYGDISPRTAAHAAKDLLTRAVPYLVIEKFGQVKPIPEKSSKTIKFRRYNALSTTPNQLTEGVTPAAQTLTKTDVEATLVQYGDLIGITDVVMDTHEDPVLKEATSILGEQAAEMIENVRFNVIKAGTNVTYAGASGSTAAGRSTVAGPITRGLQRLVVRELKRQNAKFITSAVKSSARFNTENVLPTYIALCHPDCESDIRDMDGFIDVKDYGNMSPFESEIGAVENVRYLHSTVFTPWEDSGAESETLVSTSGTNADVYPIIFLGRDAFGIVPFKGNNAVTPTVVNPSPSESDPLGQRGYVGWKAYQTAIILNDAWMRRLEVGVSE